MTKHCFFGKAFFFKERFAIKGLNETFLQAKTFTKKCLRCFFASKNLYKKTLFFQTFRKSFTNKLLRKV
ncbi:MAG: hypothetical protein WA977_09050 [Halobacteriota archaeon]